MLSALLVKYESNPYEVHMVRDAFITGLIRFLIALVVAGKKYSHL